MDECKADPCAVAAELKEKSPRTIIHFIALGEKSEEKLAELACVPEQTGGIFAAAQNEAELNEALQKVFQLAALGTSEDPEGLPMPPVAPPVGAGWARPAEADLHRPRHACSVCDPRQGQPAADQRPDLAHL